MDNTAMAVISTIMLTFGFINGYIMAKISELSLIAELKAKLYEIEDENEELNDYITELETKNEYAKSVLEGKVSLPPPPIAKRTETYVANDDDEDESPTVSSP